MADVGSGREHSFSALLSLCFACPVPLAASLGSTPPSPTLAAVVEGADVSEKAGVAPSSDVEVVTAAVFAPLNENPFVSVEVADVAVYKISVENRIPMNYIYI